MEPNVQESQGASEEASPTLLINLAITLSIKPTLWSKANKIDTIFGNIYARIEIVPHFWKAHEEKNRKLSPAIFHSLICFYLFDNFEHQGCLCGFEFMRKLVEERDNNGVLHNYINEKCPYLGNGDLWSWLAMWTTI